MTINARPYTVIGVLPPRVKFPFLQVAWIPLAPLVATPPRQARDLEVFAPDRRGRTLAQARDGAVGDRRPAGAAAIPENDGWGVRRRAAAPTTTCRRR